jgi:hypothetical protein
VSHVSSEFIGWKDGDNALRGPGGRGRRELCDGDLEGVRWSSNGHNSCSFDACGDDLLRHERAGSDFGHGIVLVGVASVSSSNAMPMCMGRLWRCAEKEGSSPFASPDEVNRKTPMT